MERIFGKIYRINGFEKDFSIKDWLYENGFHYNRLFSSDGENAYIKRFPVYKYRIYTVLECELVFYISTNHIKINIYDYNTRDVYEPFYCNECGNKILKEIERNINVELDNLGIKLSENI